MPMQGRAAICASLGAWGSSTSEIRTGVTRVGERRLRCRGPQEEPYPHRSGTESKEGARPSLPVLQLLKLLIWRSCLAYCLWVVTWLKPSGDSPLT